jgi:hypothetical protein
VIIAVTIAPALAIEEETGPAMDETRQAHGATRIERHPLREDTPARPVVTFRFDGVPIEARAGEPVAAALLAAGIRVLRTMPRFRDARGGYCMVGRCPDCAVVVAGVPNVRSCVTPVTAGLELHRQHGLGALEPPS